MKRVLCALMLLALLPISGGLAEELPEQLTLAPGESRTFTLPFSGYWESDALEVAQGEGDTITAYEEGSAILVLISPQGQERRLEVQVTGETAADAIPPLVAEAIRIALAEWQENQGKTFSQKNKYSNWYCKGCSFGWCGAFVSYCMDMAGIPLEPSDTYTKVKPHEGGVPYGIREAAVPKLYTGFQNMERLTQIPKPGYLVIYGKRDYYAYVHVGMVTDVIDRGEGVYQIFTVEGNVSSRIKRYSYLYDTNARADKNMSATPESERTAPDIYQYTPHQAEWYVNTFCQVWGEEALK